MTAKTNTAGGMSLAQQRTRAGVWMLLPGIAIILGITLVPILTTFFLSFFQTPLSQPVPETFVGIGNYLEFLRSEVFWQTIGRTAYFTLVSVAIELVLGLAVATLIHAHPPG